MIVSEFDLRPFIINSIIIALLYTAVAVEAA